MAYKVLCLAVSNWLIYSSFWSKVLYHYDERKSQDVLHFLNEINENSAAEDRNYTPSHELLHSNRIV